MVGRLPFQQYITSVAEELRGMNRDQSFAVRTLHRASQAYLRGLKEQHCCGAAAKKQSTDFLLRLSWMGLKQMMTSMVNDKVLTKKVKENRSQNEDNHHHHHHHHHQHEHEHHNNDGDGDEDDEENEENENENNNGAEEDPLAVDDDDTSNGDGEVNPVLENLYIDMLLD